MIINAEKMVMGRVAAFAAKQAMLGEKVDIINCEKAIITGKKQMVLKVWKRKQQMGVPKKGPFILRQPDKFFRRVVRGMLPYKQPRGRDAFAKIMCHVGEPSKLEGKNSPKIHNAGISKLTNLDYVTVLEVCKELGAKIPEEKLVIETPKPIKEEKKEEAPKEEKAEEVKEESPAEGPKEEKPAEETKEVKEKSAEGSEEKKEEKIEPTEAPKEDNAEEEKKE